MKQAKRKGIIGECPLCSTEAQSRVLYYTEVTGVYECAFCGAIHGQCYKGDSYTLVKPFFHPNPNEVEAEDTRYYDLTVLGSDGVTRRHGWFDPKTKTIIQVG